jgi:hypothetical protein
MSGVPLRRRRSPDARAAPAANAPAAGLAGVPAFFPVDVFAAAAFVAVFFAAAAFVVVFFAAAAFVVVFFAAALLESAVTAGSCRRLGRALRRCRPRRR